MIFPLLKTGVFQAVLKQKQGNNHENNKPILLKLYEPILTGQGIGEGGLLSP
jgi:hypothetical protein